MRNETSPNDQRIIAVSKSGRHTFSKQNAGSIRLVAGLGVEGDAHMGEKVKHRSHVKKNPDRPNLRQVHLIHNELFDEFAAAGFSVLPGEMGENITTQGIDLLGLPTGTKLHLGGSAVVQITGVRNPCSQIDDFQQGLMAACLDRDQDGNLVRKSGVMGIVLAGGEVRAGDEIRVELPAGPYTPLEKV